MRVLFLTHRLPYAPNRGDRIRAYHIVQSLRERVDLQIASLVHSTAELAEVRRMTESGLDVEARMTSRVKNYLRAGLALAGPQPLTHVLLHADGFRELLFELVDTKPPDVVLAYCTGMARYALEPPLARLPLVIDFVDVDSGKWSDMADQFQPPLRWVYRREARCLAAFERTAATQARLNVITNPREAEALSRIAPSALVRVLPNGIDLDYFRPRRGPTESVHVVFCGVMNYAPNVEGVLWFAREVWPHIRSKRADALFSIVGADPSTKIQRLASEQNGISVTGTVPDVREHLWNAAVSIAPLHMGRGIQNKVLEALAAGLPTVVTSRVMEGLPTSVRGGCAVADLPEAFGDAVLSLLDRSAETRRAIAGRVSLETLSWTQQLEPLYEMLTTARQTS